MLQLGQHVRSTLLGALDLGHQGDERAAEPDGLREPPELALEPLGFRREPVPTFGVDVGFAGVELDRG